MSYFIIWIEPDGTRQTFRLYTQSAKVLGEFIQDVLNKGCKIHNIKLVEQSPALQR